MRERLCDHRRGRNRTAKPEAWNRIRDNALLANPMANSTTLFRTDVARRLGGYDETLPQFADWDFWLKMGEAGKLYNFPDYFVNYQMWHKSASFRDQSENSKAALRIVRKYRGRYPHYISALVLTLGYWLYAKNPAAVKRVLNPALSRLKKALFSR
jgi:hypothetical protein